MSTQRHIVHRQMLELTLASEPNARDVMDEVRRVYYDRLLGILDDVFSRFAPEGTVLRLDRLEIDLGRIDRQSLEADLASRLRRHLEDALKQCRFEPDGADGSADRPVRVSVADARRAALLEFIRTGSLPWWAPSPATFSPEAELQEVLESDGRGLAAELRSLASQVILSRLSLQFDPSVLAKLAGILDPERAEAAREARTAWTRLLSVRPRLVPVASQALLWEITFKLIFQTAAAAIPPAFHLEVVRALAADAFVEPAVIVRLLVRHAAAHLPKDDALRKWLELEPPQAARASEPSIDDPLSRPEMPAERTGPSSPREAPPSAREADSSRSGTSETKRPARPAHGPDREPLAQPPARPPREPHGRDLPPDSGDERRRSQAQRERFEEPFFTPDREDETAPSTEALYVYNAGLVLLWPFLGRFFKEIGLLKDRAFVSEPAHRRAVLLTQHLATGSAEAPEHHLLLNKILCGYPVEEAVERRIELSDEETAAASLLLSAVIAQWDALKNTSIHGLQQAFLQREGRLVRRERAWHLHVDRTGHDVLLDRLPWSCSIVMQPWMEAPMYVEW